LTLAPLPGTMARMSVPDRLERLFPAPADIPERFRLAPVHQTEYLIDGEIRRWEGPVQEVLSPICLREGDREEPALIGSYPLLTERESEQALAAAVRAYDHGRGLWPTLAVEKRIAHVEAFVARMRAERAAVVRLLMWEIGKNLADAEKEFDRTVDYIVDTVRALKELDRQSSRFVSEGGIVGQIRRAPLGVALCMGPFNYPLNETFTTMIPALIMGNTVVFKPAKLGVLLHQPLLAAFRDCFPAGVVNSVYGDGAKVVGPLMTSGKIDVLAFIGSSRVADILKKQHPQPHRLRGVLGLEAKNPGIVLADADLALAAKECLLGALSYNGQRCTALKILFVARPVLARFIELFNAELAKLTGGMPWENTALTPLPEPGKGDWLTSLVEDAVEKGAQVVNPEGGRRRGTFFYPAVVCPVAPTAQLYRVEQFGPVVPIVPFDSVDEPVSYMIESSYGQQVSIFGSDPAALARLIDPLVNQVCRVNLNCQCQRGPDSFPFTGRKDSAEGTLSISDALRAFSIRTLVAAKESELNKGILTTILRERQSAFLSTDFIF
jgi:glyceraldehyde-3-phosphate dehydrogenase (NADP+)